jgi:hypothetical protein
MWGALGGHMRVPTWGMATTPITNRSNSPQCHRCTRLGIGAPHSDQLPTKHSGVGFWTVTDPVPETTANLRGLPLIATGTAYPSVVP